MYVSPVIGVHAVRKLSTLHDYIKEAVSCYEGSKTGAGSANKEYHSPRERL
jgi:hypothetical protein